MEEEITYSELMTWIITAFWVVVIPLIKYFYSQLTGKIEKLQKDLDSLGESSRDKNSEVEKEVARIDRTLSERLVGVEKSQKSDHDWVVNINKSIGDLRDRSTG